LQYIPSKRHRFRTNVFVVSDCEAGYIQDFIICMGTNTNVVAEREFGMSVAVVHTLMQKYLMKGHNLWLDIFIPVLCSIIGYTNVEPVHLLQLEGTGKECHK
jgi:hypothetical protein